MALTSTVRTISDGSVYDIIYDFIHDVIYDTIFDVAYDVFYNRVRHDPAAITAHVTKILNFYLPQLPNANRKMFYLVTQFLPRCYPQISNISYNFSEAEHGKGPADGVGGSLKKLADDKVKYEQDIPDFETLVSTLHDCIKTVHINGVKAEEIETIDVVLPD